MKFYLKLALGNIKKNKKLYSSYFISTIFSIALYFIIKTVGNSPTLKGQDSITDVFKPRRLCDCPLLFDFLILYQ